MTAAHPPNESGVYRLHRGSLVILRSPLKSFNLSRDPLDRLLFGCCLLGSMMIDVSVA
jgi:hypothetical protein